MPMLVLDTKYIDELLITNLTVTETLVNTNQNYTVCAAFRTYEAGYAEATRIL